MTDRKKAFSEEIIADFIKKELAASTGTVQWDHGNLIYEGRDHNFLIEVKAFRIPKEHRFTEEA